MLIEPRPELLQVADVVHGALDFTELEHLGLVPEAVLDFSVNGNAYGPSPKVREAMARVPVDRYPDREAMALRRALAEHLGAALDWILVGNGSMELVWLVALAFLRPGDAVLILDPTFGEYQRAVKLMGAQIHSCTARPEEAFHLDPDAILAVLRQLAPRLVFLCNPNNPTGAYVPLETIAAWVTALPRTLFVIDEAYLTFARGARSVLTLQADNVLLLRSMTKAYALAGIRLGYAVGHPDVLAVLRQVRPPWSVNALAQAAGVAALTDVAHIERSLAQVAQAKQRLVAELYRLGLEPVPSSTHFFLLKVGNATACRQALLQRGLLVRDCTSFGLPAYIRVATRRPEENAQLLAALAETR
jgi:L-threonine-O-3-phosphate decarboxylase